jgi:hypothetical protein
MPINPNIALSARGIELQNPLDQYSKVTAIRNAQQQNQLAQMQMQQSERDLASTNALNQAYAKAYNTKTGEVDLNALRGSLATGGYGSKIPGIEKSLLELQSARTTQKKLEGEVAAQPTALATAQSNLLNDKLKQSRQFLETINPADPNAAEAYMAWHRANHADPVIGEALKARGVTVDQSMTRIQQLMQTPGGLARLINESKLGTEKFMEMNKPTLSTVDTGSEMVSQSFEPLTKEITTIRKLKKELAPGEAQRIKQEGQRIGLEGRRVAVLEENARRDADPVFQQNMAAAKETGIAIAKGDVAAVQALPKVITRAEETIRTIDQLIGKRDTKTGKLLKGEKTHPGFTGAVGATWLPGLRFVDGTDEASFMSRFDQIKGASFLEAFESLKGGGAITKDEGNKATDAINRMSIASDEKEFIRAAMDLQDVVRKGVANAQAKAAKAGSRNAPAPAAGGGVDTSNPLLK